MPDDVGTQNPAGNANSDPRPIPPVDPSIEQRIVALEAQSHTHQKPEEPNRPVKTIRSGEIMPIVINALLLVATIVIAKIYYGQLNEMTYATNASERSAYAACIGAQISRSSFVELQKSTEEQHQAAVASIYQALAATQSEVAFINANASFHKFKPGDPILAHLEVENIGKTPAINLTGKMRVELVSVDGEPSLTYPKGQTSVAMRTRFINGDKLFGDESTLAVKSRDGAEYKATLDDSTQVQSKQKSVIAYGVFSFDDIFGVRHRTAFCHSTAAYVDGPVNLTHFPKCKEYNQADKNTAIPKPTKLDETITQLPEITCYAPSAPRERTWFQKLFW